MARKPQRRGFGRLRELPSGRWQAGYTGPDMIVHKAPDTFATKGRAEGWLSDERRLLDLGVWTSPSDRATAVQAQQAPVLFGAYALKVIRTRTSKHGGPLAYRTVEGYESLLRNHLNPTFEDQPVDDTFTVEMVRDWYSSVHGIRYKGKKAKGGKPIADVPTTRARAYELLRMVCNVAVDEDKLMTVSPCRIKGATVVTAKREGVAMLPVDVDAIVAQMPEPLRAGVLLGVWCAPRPSELFELRRKDFSRDCSVLKVKRNVIRRNGKFIVSDNPKSGSHGDVVVPHHIREAIRDHLERFAARGPNALFLPDPESGEWMREWIFRDLFYAAIERAGLQDLRVYDMRTTSGTMAAIAGGTLPEIMQRLRHKTSNAAMRYQKVASGRPEELADNMSKLAKR